MSAPTQNKSEKGVKSITDAIEKVTGTSDPFATTEIGKQFNRLGVSDLRLGGKAMELSNYFSEKMNDALRYVAPDSVDELLNKQDQTNRETAQALQNANSALTGEDNYIDTKARTEGYKIPVAEDLANKIMYFPEAIPNAIDSAIRGDFKDDDGSYSDRVGKIIGGLNPAGDLRDLIANGKNVFEGKPDAWIGLGAAAVGIIPVIGDGGKIIRKLEKKVIAETIEKLIKSGVEKEAAEKIAKEEVGELVKEAVEKQYDEIAKSGHAVQRHGESITDRQLDDRAMKGVDPASGNTFDAYKKLPDGTPAPHKYSKDATKFVSKDALVKTESFVKSSQQFEDAVKLGTPEIKVERVKLEDIFGAEYKKEVFGKTRIGTKNNPVKNKFTLPEFSKVNF